MQAGTDIGFFELVGDLDAISILEALDAAPRSMDAEVSPCLDGYVATHRRADGVSDRSVKEG